MESTAESPHHTPIVDLRESFGFKLLEEKIRVPKVQIGAEYWEEMLELANTDLVEKGRIVSWTGKKYMVSDLIEGRAEKVDYDNPSQKIPASISPPIFPHGLSSADPRVRAITFVHAHPMPKELDHLKGTAISADDIAAAIQGRFAAVVAIDRGGVHMLIKEKQLIQLEVSHVDPVKIVNEALRRARAIPRLRKEIALSIRPFDIRYYFSSHTKPTDANTIHFSDAATSEIINAP